MIIEESCKEVCPEKCISSKWQYYDPDDKQWRKKNKQIVNIECRKLFESLLFDNSTNKINKYIWIQ